jgi:hypothetical protein
MWDGGTKDEGTRACRQARTSSNSNVVLLSQFALHSVCIHSTAEIRGRRASIGMSWSHFSNLGQANAVLQDHWPGSEGFHSIRQHQPQAYERGQWGPRTPAVTTTTCCTSAPASRCKISPALTLDGVPHAQISLGLGGHHQ